MYYKLSRLLLTPTSARPSTTAEVFIANPQIDQEAILGKLFFVAEIESTKPAALKVIQFFATALPQAYYQSEKISLKEKMGALNIAELFENALTKVNAEFENFCKKEKIRLGPESIAITSGVVYKNTLVFSAVGSIKALLACAEIKKEADDDYKKIYKISLLDESGTPETKPSQHKLFTNITEGVIPPEGYVIFTNNILPEYITNKNLTKIVTTLPPVSAVEQIKNQLHKINSYVTFLALIIKSSTKPNIQRPVTVPGGTAAAHSSLERMEETETATERYLSSAGIVSTGRLLRAGKKLLNVWPFVSPETTRTVVRDKIFFAKKNHWRFINKSAAYAKSLLDIAAALSAYILRAFSHPRRTLQTLRNEAKLLKAAGKNALAQTLRWLLNLSTARKTLLGTFIICGLLLSYNIYALVHEKTQAADRQNYQTLTQDIQQKQNQIKTKLLYGNETGARELLTQTGEFIDELTGYAAAEQTLIDELRRTNATLTETISHVVAIPSPREIAALKTLDADVRPNAMAMLMDGMVVADAQKKRLYSVAKDGTARVISSDAGSALFGVSLTDNAALFLSFGGGATVSADGAVSAVTTAFAASNNAIKSAAGYNGRLYLLSTADNNIWRFNAGYTEKTPWIKENIDIGDAIDFAIDGYIYLLRTNGDILKMLSGYTTAFELTAVNPSITAPTKIRLSKNSDNGFIYLLEPAKKRIVVFDKQGEFILQYKISLTADITDFAVAPAGDKIIILAGQSLYEFDASHDK